MGIRVGVAWVNRCKKNLPPAKETQTNEPTTDHPDNELMEIVIRVLNMVERTLLLCILEGYTYEETADLMGISYENVRVKIHRIRKKLRN